MIKGMCRASGTKEYDPKHQITDCSDRFRLEDLKEKGMLQYFYHSPSSELPIRDVLGEYKIRRKGRVRSVGKKTEPHIEIGAENYLNDCCQPNIKRFLRSDAKYLFLLATCRKKEMKDYFGDQFVVGYMIKEDWGYRKGKRKGSVFVKGKTRLYEFRDSMPSKKLFGKNLGRNGIIQNLWTGNTKTRKILGHFSKKRSISPRRYLQEINRLDREGATCYLDRGCEYSKSCLRFS
ncbi:hypothetical protein MUP05_03675 [Candidatus Bathyarchaeota archaeon]|nr:hypothetical protein [Candidatus Bathyarchaeota archaeon]